MAAGSNSEQSFGVTLHPRWGILGTDAAEGGLGRRQVPHGWKAPASPAPGTPGVRFLGVRKLASVTGRDGGHARWPTGRGSPPQAAVPSTPTLGPGPGSHAPSPPSSGGRRREGPPCWNKPGTFTRPLRLQLLGCRKVTPRCPRDFGEDRLVGGQRSAAAQGRGEAVRGPRATPSLPLSE